MYQSALLHRLGIPFFMSGIREGNQAFRWSAAPHEVRGHRDRFLGMLRTAGHWPLFMPGNGVVMVGWLEPGEPEIVTVGRAETGAGIYWVRDPRFPDSLSGSVQDAIPAEALVTQERGVFLGALVADCPCAAIVEPTLPVLAFVHCSRKMLKAKLLARVVHTICDKFSLAPAELFAAIGPGIQAQSYLFPRQVFRDVFGDTLGDGDWQPFCDLGRDPVAVDLAGFNRHLLVMAGIPDDHIDVSPLDTLMARDPADPERYRFFSHRRAVLNGEPEGRCMAVCGLP